MKRFFLFSVLLVFTGFIFANELSDSELKVLYSVLDARFYVDDYEELNDKLEYLQQKQSEYHSLSDGISEEAKLICDSIFLQEIETAKKEELEKKDTKVNKQEKTAKESEIEAQLMACYKDYQEYAASHSDLSSHFNYHYREVEFSILAYLSTSEQLKILKGVLDNYKAIEEQNPDLSENLFMLGCVLYMMPKIAGGDKNLAKEKIIKAIDCAACVYEETSAYVMLSQILYEEKNRDEAKVYLEKVIEINPNNKNIKLIKEANEAGYSMFELDKYLKKK